MLVGLTHGESLKLELLKGEGEIPLNDLKVKGNVSEHSEDSDSANRDIGGAQLGGQLLAEIDKLAQVNSAGVEPDLATTKMADQTQQPNRAGKSLSQRPVTIQVKPQDISIIFSRTNVLAKSSDRIPQVSQEQLSRIFNIYDTSNVEVISQANKGSTEPEVSRDLDANDLIINQRDNESRKADDAISDEQFSSQSEQNKEGNKQIPDDQKPEESPHELKAERKVRKPEGRSLDINSTEYKYYIKDDEEVVEINDTKPSLIHKAVVINRPLYDHNQRVGQLSSLESPASTMKKTIIKISQSNMIGIGLGCLLFFLTLAVLLGLVFQKTNYLKKADSMEDNFVSFDTTTDIPSRFGQNHSLGSWPLDQEIKGSSHEDLDSLDNDSFLNSLEAITTCEYWSETSWNT